MLIFASPSLKLDGEEKEPDGGVEDGGGEDALGALIKEPEDRAFPERDQEHERVRPITRRLGSLAVINVESLPDGIERGGDDQAVAEFGIQYPEAAREHPVQPGLDRAPVKQLAQGAE